MTKQVEDIYFKVRKNVNACFLYDSLLDAINYFAGRRPLRKHTTKINPPPFFIVGSGRSGNTLLRAILTAHPNVSIPPESYVLGRAVRRFQAYSFLKWEIIVKLILSEFEYHNQFESWGISLQSVYGELKKIPKDERDLARILDRIYQKYIDIHMPSATRWGDKTPVNTFHLNWIDRVFPKAKYVHMVRDGRDVVSSYLESEIYTSIEGAINRWMRSVKLAKDFEKERSERFLEVRYEKLVQNPKQEVSRVCDFLGVEFNEEMLNFQNNVEKLGDTRLPHHRGLKRPINTKSIGSWRNRLTDLQKRKVKKEVSSLLQDIGYSE